MVELADIFRLYGQAYRTKFAGRIPAHHLCAMYDIEHCRSAAMGGQLYLCPQCNEFRYSYHSCKNRHCPKCQNDQAQQWLQTQQNLLLPVPHFLVTFTLPDELRAITRSHQQICYNILFRASSQALLQLAADPRFVGGKIGMVGVLHTWSRNLIYHPHVHYIATGGGLSEDGVWHPARGDFLVHVHPLSVLFRAKFRDLLKKTDLFSLVDDKLWHKNWIVHCQPVGNGEAALRYLAPYILRVAISNNRILKLENSQVTFQYKDSATDQLKYCTLTAEEFIRRFLQHILPDNFIKVRYYGLFSPTNRPLLLRLRLLLTTTRPPTQPKPQPLAPTCPCCHSILIFLARLKPAGRSPP